MKEKQIGNKSRKGKNELRIKQKIPGNNNE